MKKILLLIVMTHLLAACSTMNSSFDCPNKAGVSCKSLDQINNMVDSGQLQGRTQMSFYDNNQAENPEFQSFPTMTSYVPGAPIRYGETVQRIWIAPYEDNEGNYHQDNLIYAIMKGGHWIGRPVKSVRAI